MNGLDLFSGIGGISIALKQFGVRTVAYCESDRYAQGVLLSRMRSGQIDTAPIWDDVRTLTKEHLPRIDIISGGFPCQNISFAGNGKGLDGEHSRLFFEIARLACDLRPKFIFLENVPAISVRGIDRVLLELTSIGYDSRWTIVSAAEVGACHLRKRWFLLAHLNSEHRRIKLQSEQHEQEARACATSKQRNASDTLREGLEGQWDGAERERTKLPKPCEYGRWTSQPHVLRGAHGVRNRMDRIRCLGNSVVPVAVEKAIKKLMTMGKD